MNVELREELKNLVQKTEGPKASIFMPTYRAGNEVQQNPIRLSNLLREAEKRIIEFGLRSVEARELLRPAQELLDDRFFWRHQSDGLALFVSSELFRTYRLPTRFDQLAVVNDRFYLKPLFALFGGDSRFFVLALSQKEVRLLDCTRFGVAEITLENVPKSIDEALKYDESEKQLQFHTGTSGSVGARRPAMFHGHGVGVDDTKTNIWRYFLMINDGLHDVLKDEQAPLVLAGVDYLLPIYRETSTYPHLFDESITGNPDGLTAGELHKRALALVQPYFHRAEKEARDKYMASAGTGLASGDLREVVAAASFGRVEALFVPLSRQQWGSFDPTTGKVELHETAEKGDEDLVDTAAIQTFLHAGSVFAVEPEKIPGGGLVAGVFRY